MNERRRCDSKCMAATRLKRVYPYMVIKVVADSKPHVREMEADFLAR